MAFRVFPALLGVSLGLGAAVRPARADEPVRVVTFAPDELPPPSARLRLLGYGTALAAGSYGAALAASFSFPDDPGTADLRIPLVGPWLKLGQTRLCPSAADDPTCNNVYQVAGAIFVGLDGLIQAGSLALLVQSIFLRTSSGSESNSGPTASFGTSNYVGGSAPRSSSAYAGHGYYRDSSVSSPKSPFLLELGPIKMMPSFSSVRGADASFGWIGAF